MQNGAVFVDWLTVTQSHPEEQGSIPLILRGLTTHNTPAGVCVLERLSPAHIAGSFGTTVLVSCDGSSVFLSGNVGRLSRKDNLFNYGWAGTAAQACRICGALGIPRFSGAAKSSNGQESGRLGARLHRLDLTANFATGSDGQARALIRWLSSRSIARTKKGMAGDESVWFSNTRRMVKAYNKAAEMIAHGMDKNSQEVEFAFDNGIVRVEIGARRKLLAEYGCDEWGNVTQAKLEQLYHDATGILRSVDRSDEPDILSAIPARSRMYAAAWLAGKDLSALASRATLYRHARVCGEYGIDLFQRRDSVKDFPVRVRVIDLQPMEKPHWYELKEQAA